MVEPISSYTYESILVVAFEKAVASLDSNLVREACCFHIYTGSRTDNNGQTIKFLTEAPSALLDDLKSWNFSTVTLKEKHSLVASLQFESKYFLSESPNVGVFVLEWSAAFTKWEKEQSEHVRQSLLLHPLSEVICYRGRGGIVSMQMTLRISEKVHASLDDLRMAL